jgi:Fe-S oxidoreductase
MGLEDYKGDLEMCCRCSACKFVPMQKANGMKYTEVCPSISKYNFHSYSAGGRLNICLSMLNGEVPRTERLSHIVYNCTMCGACGVSCNYSMDMEVMEPIIEMRKQLIDEGRTDPALETAVQRLRETSAMVGSQARRGNWASGLSVRNALAERVDVLYHVGCLTSSDERLQSRATATVKILEAGGADFGIAGDAEACCGGRAYGMGYEEAAFERAKANMALIAKTGAKTLVTSCAECYAAFAVLYDKFGLKGDLEVLHVTQYMDRLLGEGRLEFTKKLDLDVTYHDPCHLGRLGEPWIHWEGEKVPGVRFVFDPPKVYRRGTDGIYEAPRNVLTSIPGVRVTEMPRTKEYAWCCGAGGGVKESNSEFSQWAAAERIEEARDSGAEAIATACPWCEKNFSDAISGGAQEIGIYDIVELAAQAL